MIANFLHHPGFWLESNILFGLRSLIQTPKIPALDAQPKDAQRIPLQSCIPIVCRRASNDHVSESPTEIPNQRKTVVYEYIDVLHVVQRNICLSRPKITIPYYTQTSSGACIFEMSL